MKKIIILTTILFSINMPLAYSKQKVEIMAPLASGELLDKITILTIKREKIHDKEKHANVDQEYNLLTQIYKDKIKPSSKLQNLIEKLLETNRHLWNLEDSIREKERNKEFDEKFKQLVKSILENNDTRFKIKQSINITLNSSLIEEKSYEQPLASDIASFDNYNLFQKASLINIPISLADLLDRISILEIKLEKINNHKKLTNIRHEYTMLITIYKNTIETSIKLEQLYQELLTINKKMWNIQDIIRKKVLENKLDNEFIKLGRNVYYTNDKRIHIKKNINQLFNSALTDEKVYTSY